MSPLILIPLFMLLVVGCTVFFLWFDGAYDEESR